MDGNAFLFKRKTVNLIDLFCDRDRCPTDIFYMWSSDGGRAPPWIATRWLRQMLDIKVFFGNDFEKHGNDT